ncbi:BC1872 family protein [Paenibacillus polymyxa]|uniref:BC1872 family protein n=1 Tax=Paenibacillus polymyxa TaxID=1406 RepID=UPI003D290A3B
MTRDEVIAKWNSMQPQERDIWVATDVMGYKADRVRPGMIINSKGYSTSPAMYSTDIGAAWEVLKKFKTYQITYSESGFSHPGMKYRVIVGRNQDVAYSDIETEAICLATLIATQGEE